MLDSQSNHGIKDFDDFSDQKPKQPYHQQQVSHMLSQFSSQNNIFSAFNKNAKSMHPAELMKDFRMNPDGTDPFAFNNSGSV